jgi:SAM-dependent methyltransferase
MSTLTPDRPYPRDGDLRGYFAAARSDGQPAAAAGYVRNLDFLRLRDAALHLLDARPGQRVLDVGCAGGPVMTLCGLQGAEVYGQDIDPVAVAAANDALRRFGLSGRAVTGDARALLFADNYFDSVISGDFFEHITDGVKVEVLGEIRRVLKPGGLCVIKTPNLAYLRLSLAYKRARAVLRLRDPRGIRIPHTPGTDDPQHTGLVSRRGLTRCLVAAGFVNYRFHYAPLRRFGHSPLAEVLSTEIPVARDLLCEDVFCAARKPISTAHFA